MTFKIVALSVSSFKASYNTSFLFLFLFVFLCVSPSSFPHSPLMCVDVDVCAHAKGVLFRESRHMPIMVYMCILENNFRCCPCFYLDRVCLLFFGLHVPSYLAKEFLGFLQFPMPIWPQEHRDYRHLLLCLALQGL